MYKKFIRKNKRWRIENLKTIKELLQIDIRLSNKQLLETQELIDEAFGIMLDNLSDTVEYKEAKAQYDIRSQEKWWYCGRIKGIETALKYIKNKEEDDANFAKYCEEVGAEELPF